jgi:hypothetical protein
MACSDPNPTFGKPGPFDVWIFNTKNFVDTTRTSCKSLGPGLYPHAWNMGLPDNSIVSIKVGDSVRARLFLDGNYGRPTDFLTVFGGQEIPNLGRFSQTSSMRVEIDDDRPDCMAKKIDRAREFALYTDPFFNGDCIVVPAFGDEGQPNAFPTVEYMGIADNAISSLVTGPCNIVAFSGPFFSGSVAFVYPGSGFNTAVDTFRTLPGDNDTISSILLEDCLTPEK